jgi:DNA-binding NarL/FixJ family response regulator
MKILIVDDHALFRDGLRLLLQGLAEQITVLEAGDYGQVLQHIATTTNLDLLLLDLDMPGMDGFDILARFTAQFPTVPVVIISASTQRVDMQCALDAGAMGYIPKDTTSDIMLNAIRLVLSGGVYVPANMTHKVDTGPAAEALDAMILTPRQLQVLALLLRGDSNKSIALQMNLAETTIKMHVTSILQRLGVSNRTQAAVVAEKLGLFNAQD